MAVDRDRVARTEKGLLTLTTTAGDGPVASESLTVREADFHPVARKIELRNAETIEIAEVSYNVLPWSSVNPDLFEPPFMSSSSLSGDTHPSLTGHLPLPLTETQIDAAELGVQLVLSRLHLDANAGISLNRAADGVHVQGVVESNAVKHQIQAQLYQIPNVFPSIFTVREMASRPNAGSEITSIRQTSVAAAAPSALERHFLAHNMDRSGVAASAQHFVDSAFAIKHESEQIAGLLDRFSSNATLSPEARTELSELLVEHKAKLLDALADEERQLVALQLVSRPAGAEADGSASANALRLMADRNFSACVQLISAADSSASPPQAIASQLADSIAQLRATTLQISAAAQLSSTEGKAALEKQKR